eukprot:483104-Rhodomonas_salina.1
MGWLVVGDWYGDDVGNDEATVFDDAGGDGRMGGVHLVVDVVLDVAPKVLEADWVVVNSVIRGPALGWERCLVRSEAVFDFVDSGFLQILGAIFGCEVAYVGAELNGSGGLVGAGAMEEFAGPMNGAARGDDDLAAPRRIRVVELGAVEVHGVGLGEVESEFVAGFVLVGGGNAIAVGGVVVRAELMAEVDAVGPRGEDDGAAGEREFALQVCGKL